MKTNLARKKDEIYFLRNRGDDDDLHAKIIIDINISPPPPVLSLSLSLYLLKEVGQWRKIYINTSIQPKKSSFKGMKNQENFFNYFVPSIKKILQSRKINSIKNLYLKLNTNNLFHNVYI